MYLTAVKAFELLYKKKKYKTEDLFTEQPYKDLVFKTNTLLGKAVADNVIGDVMKDALTNDVFIFSHLRTHAQLMQASSLLLKEDGTVKGFDAFKMDIKKLNETFNENYLQAEYNFAVHSSQMAEKWANLNESNRYNLQYRTALDDKVRISHQPLHNVTLPMQHEFWDSFYPPNGWRCRCTATQVRASKYPSTNEENAMKAGRIATSHIGKDGKNKLAIFQFNAGKHRVAFPPDHPYNKIKDADKLVNDIKTEKFVPNNIEDYENKIGVKINREFFANLKIETPLHFKNPKNSGTKSSGAYFHPTQNFVKIPIDDRRKKSSWYGEAIFYHEYGHAIDWQRNLKKLDSLSKTLTKHRKVIKDDFEKFKALDQKLYNMGYRAYKNNNYNLMEMIGAVQDTLKSIDIRIGSGHTDQYFKVEGNSEAEFIAHAFENKFKGNPVFKKYLPELYEDMIKWIDETL